MDFSKTETTKYPKAIVLHSHPPVVSAKAFAVIATTLVAGAVLSKDAQGDLIAYDPAVTGSSAVGVLLEDLDTSVATIGKVLVHGVVDASLITPNTSAVISSLAQNNIYT